MRELSLHILDIAENSLRAKASLVEILVEENSDNNKFIIKITDNGCGMTQEYASKVLDPFTTERTTRSIGLGLPMFAATAERCSGHLVLKSEPNLGTEIIVEMELENIDRPPLGDMADTIVALICHGSEFDLKYDRVIGSNKFTFDTKEIKSELDGVPLTTPSVLNWIRNYILENEKQLKQKGAY
jgi:histidine kinase/DNA gyrase B/HSP90-like ATPase